MATKTVCDGCGEEIRGANIEDRNTVTVTYGPTEKSWDACRDCRLEVEHIFVQAGGLDRLVEAP